MKTKFKRDFKLLMRKNSDRCSLCKWPFDDDEVTYTVMGYDAKRKLQVTSECCAQFIMDIRHISLCGHVDPDKIDEALRGHPLYDDFIIKKPHVSQS